MLCCAEGGRWRRDVAAAESGRGFRAVQEGFRLGCTGQLSSRPQTAGALPTGTAAAAEAQYSA